MKSVCCIRVFLTNEFINFNYPNDILSNSASMYVYLQYLVILKVATNLSHTKLQK